MYVCMYVYVYVCIITVAPKAELCLCMYVLYVCMYVCMYESGIIVSNGVRSVVSFKAISLSLLPNNPQENLIVMDADFLRDYGPERAIELQLPQVHTYIHTYIHTYNVSVYPFVIKYIHTFMYIYLILFY